VTAATYCLADIYMKRKEYKKAIPFLEQIVKKDPADAAAKKKLQNAQKQAA
jgi:cytochrome c-type biogenesis protein CcmH/NrfG